MRLGSEHAPAAWSPTSDFDWEGDRAPHTPLDETVIYETHVKGLTQRHPDVPEELARHLRGAGPSRPYWAIWSTSG